MKKILIVAALVASVVMPVTTVSAADMAAAPAPKLSPACIFLPLLPDCLAAWKATHDSMMSKAGKTAMVAPKFMALPTCTKAPAGAGHLLDCKM